MGSGWVQLHTVPLHTPPNDYECRTVKNHHCGRSAHHSYVMANTGVQTLETAQTTLVGCADYSHLSTAMANR